MARSYASTVINAPADEVWARIRDFNGLATWARRGVAKSEIEEGRRGDQVGGVRSFTLGNGERTSASGSSRPPTRSGRTRTTSRRRRSTSTTICHAPRHTGDGRRRELRGVVDNVRLQSGRAGALDGFFANEVFQGGFDALKSHFGNG